MKPRYLLDTNICIFIRKNRHPAIASRLAGLRPGEIAMSVITWGELTLGVEKSRERAQATVNLHKLRNLVPVIGLDDSVGDHYGAIRGQLEQTGNPIGPNDLWIAAHARALGIPVVTNNTREFAKVTGLAVEDWTQP